MSVKNCVHLVTTEMMSGEGCDYGFDVTINDAYKNLTFWNILLMGVEKTS